MSKLVKAPVPIPSSVCASLTVGCGEVLQQIPRAVTLEPPSKVTLPPQMAVVAVIELTVSVITEEVLTESRRQRTEKP